MRESRARVQVPQRDDNLRGVEPSLGLRELRVLVAASLTRLRAKPQEVARARTRGIGHHDACGARRYVPRGVLGGALLDVPSRKRSHERREHRGRSVRVALGARVEAAERADLRVDATGGRDVRANAPSGVQTHAHGLDDERHTSRYLRVHIPACATRVDRPEPARADAFPDLERVVETPIRVAVHRGSRRRDTRAGVPGAVRSPRCATDDESTAIDVKSHGNN